MSKTNRNFKASVFTHLFGEPENERGLFNAFSPDKLPLDSNVVDCTLTDALYKERVNELRRFVKINKMVLIVRML